MDMEAYLKGIDAQIKEDAAKEARLRDTKGERRQQHIPVAVERRSGKDRRGSKEKQ